MVMSFCGFPMIDFYQDHGLLSAAHVLITQSMYAEVDLGLLQAVNYYHKALHLGCCSSPRSASGISLDWVSNSKCNLIFFKFELVT